VLCFMHDDHHPSLYFNIKANQWRCFACEKGGNTISLVMGYKQMDFLTACRWLADNFNIDIDSDGLPYPAEGNRRINTGSIRPTTYRSTHYGRTLDGRTASGTGRSNYPFPASDSAKDKKERVVDYELFNWLFRMAGLSPRAKHFLYDERHYRQEAVAQLGIASITDSQRFAAMLTKQFGAKQALKSGLVRRVQTDDFLGENGQMVCAFVTPCLIFPYRDIHGRTISVQSRYLGDKEDLPRFQFIKGSTVSIFNKPVLKEMPQEEPLYIAEGVTDCLALMSMGHKAVAIPSATLLKTRDASLLAHRNLCMYPDADAAGEHLYEKLCALLAPYDTTVTRLPLPEGSKDVSEWYGKSFA